MSIERGDALALARALVQIDSRNPSLVIGAPGEQAVARLLGDVLEVWGFQVELRDAAPGRPNVIARAGTRNTGRSLMFNGHLDVVGVEGMVHAPWSGEERDGRVYGRGSSDMKGGIAAMCAAAARATGEDTDGEIIIAAVSDEEFQSLGTRAVVAQGIRTDAAIVAEPTGLAIMPAHRGFVWLQATFHGRAAHGSRYDIGVDAIRHAGLLLAELDILDTNTLPRRRPHPLLGRPSVHASTIAGGTGLSTYPDRCELSIEWRTLPGETAASVLAEIRASCDHIRARRPEFQCELGVIVTQGPSDVALGSPIVLALDAALHFTGDPVRIEGMSAWTDAAILNEAGIPAICFGPGDIAVAHAAEEYIAVREIRRATDVLTRLARNWCGGASVVWPR